MTATQVAEITTNSQSNGVGQSPPSFAGATEAESLGQGRFVAKVDPSFDVVRGPHGGYLAALLLRTMQRELGEPARKPRVLTVHYPKVPRHGVAELRVRVLRQGRSVSWVEAELSQSGQPCVLGRAAFSLDWQGVEYGVRTAPKVPALSAARVLPHSELPPFARHYEYRSTYGDPLQHVGEKAVGGYIRPLTAPGYDEPVLSAISDAWYPASFAHDTRPVMGATLDLTIHFRDHAAIAELRPEEFVLAVFRSHSAAEGFFEEDGEIWSADGRLLLQSRQLAVAGFFG